MKKDRGIRLVSSLPYTVAFRLLLVLIGSCWFSHLAKFTHLWTQPQSGLLCGASFGPSSCALSEILLHSHAKRPSGPRLGGQEVVWDSHIFMAPWHLQPRCRSARQV